MSTFSAQPVGATVQPCPHKPIDETKYWIEIQMINMADQPVPGLAFSVQLPNSDIAKGFLDANGYARINNIPVAGSCQISFPELDCEAWEFVETSPGR